MDHNATNKILIQTYTLIIGILLLTAKFVAYAITNSNGILTDALESIINVIAGGFGLYSLFIASKPHDDDHPYGHGKIEFISASIEGSLIFAAGIIMIIKAVYNFFYPIEVVKLDLGIILILITSVVNFIMGYVAQRNGEDRSSITLIASGQHLKADAYTSLALLLGLLVIYLTDTFWLDNIIAIAMGIFIILSGYKILQHSVAGIMDQADFILLQKVVDHMNSNRRENWVDMHNFRIIKFGERIHIDCHTTIPWYFNARDVHEELRLVENSIREAIPNNLESFIHADPCLAESCKSCIKMDCTERQHELIRKIDWTLENVMQNQKHLLD